MPEIEADDDLVMSLMEQALARPESERLAFLCAACPPDSKVFQEVCERLEWELRMDGFLLEPLIPHAEPGSKSLSTYALEPWLPGIEKPPFEPGDLLAGRFRLVREVGRGGMAVVYEAMDERLDRRIAVKCAKPGFQRRLPPEARNATEISHPNVCKTYEIHTAATPEGEVDFLTMEYLQGETLSERVRRQGRLPSGLVRDIACQICAGLAEAHRKGVIHGDLKGSNIILVDNPDGSLRAVITDFGLARQAGFSSSPRLSAARGGTPGYMAPELWRGEKASVASDLFALGVLLYHALTGQLPFGHTADWRHLKPVKIGPLKAGRRLNRVLGRCLEPEAARRPASASAVLAALQRRGVGVAAGLGRCRLDRGAGGRHRGPSRGTGQAACAAGGPAV